MFRALNSGKVFYFMCHGRGLWPPGTSIAIMLLTAHDDMFRQCQPLRFRTKQCSELLRYPGDGRGEALS